MASELERRRGARRIQDVPLEVRDALNLGRISTVNHIEHMAVDQARLWIHTFPRWSAESERFAGRSFIERLRTGGELLYDKLGPAAWLDAPPDENDMVRAWRAFAVASAELPLAAGWSAIRPFAVDDHFAVREWSWLAMRRGVCLNPRLAVADLVESEWSEPRWRRFASEVTRPRSVWGRHIGEFKQRPQLAEGLVRRLLVDDSDYVLVSVTNWLNDVASDHAAWVRTMCREAVRHGSRTAEWMERRATRRLSTKPR